HGADLKTQPDFVVNMDEKTVRDLLMFNPLLMVKDFGADEFTTSDTFMTNADVVMLATEDLIEDPVNPFTGIAFDDTEKTAHEQLIITSFEFDVETNNGNAFFPSYWVSVKDNLWNRNNWSATTQETILTEHKLP
ncbi:MAG: hypothetical protein J6L88_00495, partial [Clostridia bacterium]|nr:hypothetical protein [Clostridia bacterium]